ncbi:MAG: glycosyltransferase [Bacteroides sp.]|nr:glycosyltransferase [Bacteroides sp.]MCM1379635.1 glycosyltransferase [Bacteroides sp.]MCM1445983.1 glycosyltransferase [Prevotella sp.]
MLINNLILTPLEITAWSLGGVALVASLWLLTFYRHRIATVGASIRRQTAIPFNPSPKPAPQPVSVIILAGDHAEALDNILTKVFQQEFPSDMEVIVVNNGKNDDIKDVVTRFKHRESRQNLFITFTPPGLRNVSHRKLSLTLGVKAAHYPVIVEINEESRLYSTQWLLRMVEPFSNPEIDLVIGSALPATKFDSGFGRRYRSFTHGHDAAVWLSAALRGKPWRGHRANLAFRRDRFFEVGGFEGALNLRGGDDDLFVSKMARKGNSATVCAAQAAVRYSYPSSRREMTEGRSARMFTARNLGGGSALFFGVSSAMAWMLLVASALSIALGVYLHDWVIPGICSLLLILTILIISATWRKTLKALRCRPAALGVFPMMLRRPLTNCLHRLRSQLNRKDYYTWC